MYTYHEERRQLRNQESRIGFANPVDPAGGWGWGLLLALLTVAPRRRLRYGTGYKQGSIFPEKCRPFTANLSLTARLPPPWEIKPCTCTALHKNILSEFVFEISLST